MATALPLFAVQTHPALRPAASECLRYNFRGGDSLVYEFKSRDTITIGSRPTLYRTRTELVSVVCDFVDNTGRMYIRQTLEKYTGTEHTKTEKGDVRTTSPWLGRSAYIILDSNGKRSISRQVDTMNASLTPGGAFQPYLLVPLGDSLCHDNKNKHAWMHDQTTDTLAENGFPYPLVRHAYNYVMRGLKDTLGTKVYPISYGETGQASVRLITNKDGVYMRSVINAGGDIYHSQNGIPIAGNIGAHNKLSISMKDKPDTQGTSLTYTDYRLIYPPLPVSTPPSPKGKEKKVTKGKQSNNKKP